MRKIYFFFIPVLLLLVTSCKKDCTCSEPEVKTLTLQPGPDNGDDIIVAVRATDGGLNANANHNANTDINAGAWTYNNEGWGTGTNRTFIKFAGVSTIPASATIKSAKLSFYGVTTSSAAPQGNSYYPGSPYNSSGDNKGWLKRVTGDWTETGVTWNNKPATTDVNQAEVPASTSQWGFDATNIDVTNMIKDMVSNGQNYGFSLQMQVEQHYRTINFASSESADATKRPKLVIEYEEK